MWRNCQRFFKTSVEEWKQFIMKSSLGFGWTVASGLKTESIHLVDITTEQREADGLSNRSVPAEERFSQLCYWCPTFGTKGLCPPKGVYSHLVAASENYTSVDSEVRGSKTSQVALGLATFWSAFHAHKSTLLAPGLASLFPTNLIASAHLHQGSQSHLLSPSINTPLSIIFPLEMPQVGYTTTACEWLRFST